VSGYGDMAIFWGGIDVCKCRQAWKS
jgi:hypothetical protein